MNKLFAFCIATVVVVSSGAAQAQSLTFQSVEKTSDVVGGARTDGTTFGGQATTGTVETVWADGKKSSGTYKCMGVSMPPNDSIYNFAPFVTLMAPKVLAQPFGDAPPQARKRRRPIAPVGLLANPESTRVAGER